MELVDYFNEFSHIYKEFFDIPYRVTMGKVKEEYENTFRSLPSLMDSLYNDINESKVRGETILYVRSSSVKIGDEFKATLKLWPAISADEGERMAITFKDIEELNDYRSVNMLMDRDSVLIFSCYCVFLYLSYCSKVRGSEEDVFLEFCSRKIPNIFDEVRGVKFRIQFENLFGLNYYRIIGKGLVDSVIKTAKKVLYDEKNSN